MAVEAEDGIMVPVIRSADKTSLADLTSKYNELVGLARQRRISPDMQAGGIASVSNFGTFGVEWGTPIPLPDQTVLLGLGAGKKTPAWDEAGNQFVPVTEAQITLSFDHRSLDGGGGGRLLKRVIELLEDPAQVVVVMACGPGSPHGTHATDGTDRTRRCPISPTGPICPIRPIE